MAISKVNGLAIRATASHGATPVPMSTATSETGRAFQERYASASRLVSAGRPPIGSTRNPVSDASSVRAPATGKNPGQTAITTGLTRTQLPDQKVMPAIARQCPQSHRPKKRTRAKTRKRAQMTALHSLAEELNIVIGDIDVGGDDDSITFRSQSGYSQDTEFTLVRDGPGWQLSISTQFADDCARLRQCERALARRFEKANLGQVQLRVSLITAPGPGRPI